MLTVTNVQIQLMIENMHRAAAERVVMAMERDSPHGLRGIPLPMRRVVATAAVQLAAEHGISQDDDIARLLAGLLDHIRSSRSAVSDPAQAKE
jgi:hypothetical protein